ncbi:piggyBac transposable element-derived protein 4-like [Centruroides sculpturatus]|uniref:piggyBac transposable element-derived protein 4-like n=1 Tax=Centruroides sculpturatus TaxID=218467 RepID=UPI000C6D521F|nr:piggyBac transposable element-derived protein 4-like [Centruroides sculpturatus]XP_023244130.1 piggyBac transposable element-derived protein 4-like [Centruroides sculpturatus]
MSDSDVDYMTHSESDVDYMALSESDSDNYIPSTDDSSSSDDARSDTARTWRETDTNVFPAPPPRFPFTGTPGCRFSRNQVTEPLDYFKLFFDDELVNLITSETNRHALTRSKTSRKQWHPVSIEEMYLFFSIIILQGIINKPNERMYWTTNETLSTPSFQRLMSRNHFWEIKQNLNFTDNQNYNPRIHPNPKLNKIWPIVENLRSKCSHLYVPERNIVVDESLMLFKGHLSWKQYMPPERSRFGVKFYMLCESSSGYIYNFTIYTGKNTVLNEKYRDMPLTSKIVLSLADSLLGKGYCLTTDYFYSSPHLADYLVTVQTDFFGTVRVNRHQVPAEIQNKKLKKGETVAMQRGKVMIMKWQHKRAVTLLSTVHNPVMVSKKTPAGRIITKPQVVVDYNDTMGGVDLLDQHLRDYPVERKRGKKFYIKVFFHLLDICIFNSFVLYKINGGRMEHLQFKINIIERIIEEYHTETRVTRHGQPRTSGPRTPGPLRLMERHFPDLLPATDRKKAPTRRCAVCKTKHDGAGKKLRKETRYYCQVCDVPLCAAPCFKIYHTVEKY